MASASKFTLIAEHPALDFANTLDNRYNPQKTEELLAGYDDLLDFCRAAGMLKKADARCLRKIDEARKTAALRLARELREAIEQVFAASASGEPAPSAALTFLNEQGRAAFSHRILVQKHDHSFRWKWKDADRDALAPLWPLALAALDLLPSDRLQRVKRCGADTCRWLFLDTSKNHSRRWCDMKTCGNRSKARRFQQKTLS